MSWHNEEKDPKKFSQKNLKNIKPNGMLRVLNRQKGKKDPEKGKGGKSMTGTIVFGILGFMTMILGILAQAIPHGESRE